MTGKVGGGDIPGGLRSDMSIPHTRLHSSSHDSNKQRLITFNGDFQTGWEVATEAVNHI